MISVIRVGAYIQTMYPRARRVYAVYSCTEVHSSIVVVFMVGLAVGAFCLPEEHETKILFRTRPLELLQGERFSIVIIASIAAPATYTNSKQPGLVGVAGIRGCMSYLNYCHI